MSHPRFRSAMDTFKFNVKNKKIEEIKNVRDFNLKNLELLYLIDHCNSMKTCKVVYARKNGNAYSKMDEVYKNLSAEQKKEASDSNKAKV